eukprot:Phypoly_transcript_19543.p1 GENE.Phypoly_transcript_19543~~Phypoly_transcript_19543.p1  ORF type:complete len:110 (+),score=16.33 Phypoly_transcript_19543:191-520(+)
MTNLADPWWEPADFEISNEDNEEENVCEQLREAIKDFGGIPDPHTFLPLHKIENAQVIVDDMAKRLGIPIQIVATSSEPHSPRPSTTRIATTPGAQVHIQGDDVQRGSA